MANLILVDEINRATPRTQSALLEAMAENQVSVEGRKMALPEPFFLMATENPIEFEGTFPLPEAQRDRFFLSLEIGYPGRDIELQVVESQRRISHPVNDIIPVTALDEILELQEQITGLYVEHDVSAYILDIVEATRNHSAIRIGGSPRATIALYKSAQALAAIRGRPYVVPEDVKEMALPILQQRIILNAEYEVKGYRAKAVIEELIEQQKVPVLREQS